MTDEEKGIWNGGNTYTKRELEILRGQEDHYDAMDSEQETREDLKERQKIMDKTRIETKPMHELYKGINKRMDEPCEVTGMGGHQMKDSDRFKK